MITFQLYIVNIYRMFISRKTFRMRSNKTNKVCNSQVEIQSANPITINHTAPRMKTDIQLARYPALYYLLAFFLIALFAYLLYSVNGGDAGIPGYREKLWWQYLMAFVPLVLALLIFVFSQIETVIIQGDKIHFQKTIILGFKSYEKIQRIGSELINIIIVKKGYEMVTFTNTSFVLVFNFKGYDQLQALECTSQITAIDYLTQLNAAFPHLKGSGRKITMRDIVQE